MGYAPSRVTWCVERKERMMTLTFAELGSILVALLVKFILPAALFLLALYFVVRKAVRDAVAAKNSEQDA